MTNDFLQRQVQRLLSQAEEALDRLDWAEVRSRAEAVLDLDPDNKDAPAILAAADRAATRSGRTAAPPVEAPPSKPLTPSLPASFAKGRYVVQRFLGEGGKKKVYLAHDSLLDRDVAFALIKTEGLDDAGRVRITREAQAMGRLGNHPNIVTVYDIGDEGGQPYLVLPILSGGDVEGVIEKAPEHKLPLEQALKIAIETCQGLELAHNKGIVHRDLKPGNVWLTEDGRAMIGDFGLAVAADRSRLTQAGMMVGTVSYMPPEQAMGGEVGPRSDLYSLGAMLYEMVCGRPPFVGDESVAIIGQHLNTPPVAPTWHRPDCPPALEALILRLLEKDPSKRPASATEVREALASVTTGPRPVTVVEPAPSGGNDPLYRRTFVGRENEVKQLQAAFEGAMSGNGGLVMVVGEPGIGKTAICEQLATYVALRGGKALVGHCYEEGSLSLPYLAFVEAMRSYVLTREPDGLRSDLGTGAADVARIVSEVRDRVQGVELRPAGDPEDDRWRLLQSVTSFLRNASTVQPLAIVLEDLHWADRGTLDLLLHVSRNLQGARLLIVGTYRDVEVDRSHPLSGVLADLRRGANFNRVPLRGLTVDEVHRMYEALRGQATPWAQAEVVHRQTEGNPLFVQEVLRYLVEEGLVVREGGRYIPQVDPGVGIPEGLRDVVGKRLSHLSDGCNRLLSVAAVIGRDFDLQILRGVSNLSEDELFSSIEEAIKVGVLEERSMPGAVRYRFAHAFFRQSLYEEMIAPRRLRLHQEVARALEAHYAGRREEHAAELAEHYSQSTDRADLTKAVAYSELAASRALAVFAYAEAEGHLRRCLEVQEVLAPEDSQKRCELLIKLGETMLPQPNPRRVAETVAEEAFALAGRTGARPLAAKASLLACEASRRSLEIASLLREWAARAFDYAEVGSSDHVRAEIYLGLATISQSREQGHAHLRSAVERALGVGDQSLFYAAAGWAMSNLLALRDRDLVLRIAEKVFEERGSSTRQADLAVCLWTAGAVFLDQGQRTKAEAMWSELAEMASQTRDLTFTMQASTAPIVLSFLDGKLEDSLRLLRERDEAAAQASLLGPRSAGFIGLAGISPVVRARILHYLGHPVDEALALVSSSSRAQRTIGIVIRSFQGSFVDFGQLLIDFPGIDKPEDETAAQILLGLFEQSVLAGDQLTTAALLPRIVGLSSSISLTQAVSPGRLCGEATCLSGQYERAREFFADALEASKRVGFRPEIALIRLDLAQLLLDHYPDERDAAIEHLDFAITELRDMKMQPALERALRHRGLLKA